MRRLLTLMLPPGAAAAAVAAVLVGVVLVSRGGDEPFEISTGASTTTSSTATTTTTTTIATTIPPTTRISPAALAFLADPAHPDPDGNRRSVVTTSTMATTTTTAPPPTTKASPAPVRIPSPSCAAGLAAPTNQTAPFTGQSASIPAGLPAVVVKVSNNNSSSRAALIGLDQADVVFEERIEARATRFAAVFHSKLPANVGPVRSGRTTDIQIMRNLGTPVLGYSGSNNGVAGQLANGAANGWFVPFINTDRAPFARDGRYRAPDNLFVDPTSLGACGNGGTPYAIFKHGAATSTTAQPASSVSLDARSPYRFDWDAGSGRWLRTQDGSAHATRTGERLAPKNVVVLFVRYTPSAVDAASVDAETIGTGIAWVLRDGTITTGSWSRTRGADGYLVTDGAGVEVSLAPGNTWVVLAPANSANWS
ncbi:MAG: DUF3048 domain-containing protein [Acidimicrobiales bacterium]